MKTYRADYERETGAVEVNDPIEAETDALALIEAQKRADKKHARVISLCEVSVRIVEGFHGTSFDRKGRPVRMFVPAK